MILMRVLLLFAFSLTISAEGDDSKSDLALKEVSNTFQNFLSNMYVIGDLFHLKKTGDSKYGFDLVSRTLGSNPQISSLMSLLGIKKIEEGSSLLNNGSYNDYKCLNYIMDTASAFQRTNNSNMWLVKMVDSMGKIPSNILDANLKWYGDYEECLSISVKPLVLGNKSYGGFRGQYCRVFFPLENVSSSAAGNPLEIAICTPDICSTDEIMEELDHLFQFLGKNMFEKSDVSIKPKKVVCHSLHRSINLADIAFITVLIILLLFILMGSCLTAFEYFSKNNLHDNLGNYILLEHENLLTKCDSENGEYQKNISSDQKFAVEQVSLKSNMVSNEKSKVLEFLKCFCIFTNGKKILNINSSEQLNCLHGIRFLSMTWLIFRHSIYYSLNYSSNPLIFFRTSRGLIEQVPAHSFYSVASFFFLSGFLLCWIFLKEANKRKGKINWFLFYFIRIWRLTPPYMLVLGYFATVARYFSNGPYDEISGAYCENLWWTNLLYINNFFYRLHNCLGYTWYLAADMQLYAISPIFLYVLWRKEVIGVIIILLLLFASWISVAIISFQEKYYPFVSNIFDDNLNVTAVINENFRLEYFLYVTPYYNSGSYLVGVLTSYILYKTGDCKHFLKKWQQALGWTIATFLCTSVIFGLWNQHISLTTSMLFLTFNCTAWAVGVGWMTYMCLTGHADFLNAFLSWKFWIPLSRLTFSIYLVHGIIIELYFSSLQNAFYVTEFTMTILFLGFLVYALMAGFGLSLLIESPFAALKTLLFNKKKY